MPRKRINTASLKDISTAERHAAALELRKEGHTFQRIADKLGYSNAMGAHKAVMSALKKTLQEPSDELRNLECSRLDGMLTALYPGVFTGQPYQRARCAEVVLSIMDRRAKLLGLDAPKKTEDTHTIRVEHMAKQLADATGLDPQEIVAEAEALVLASQRDDN